MRMFVQRIPMARSQHVIKLPFGAVIRSCQAQRDEIAIHYECDDALEPYDRIVQVIYTGDLIPDSRWASCMSTSGMGPPHTSRPGRNPSSKRNERPATSNQ